MNQNPPSISRRRVVQTVAWSVPAVTLATSAPAFASSTATPAVLAGSHLSYGRPSAAGIGRFSVAPEAQISITNTGDAVLSGPMQYTLYYLLSAGVSVGSFTAPTPQDGWTFVQERELVGADIDAISDSSGIAIDVGLIRAYDFQWTGTLAPGASTPVYNFSPATQVVSGLDLLSVVSLLVDLIVPPIGYALGRYDGETTHNGANIEDYESISIIRPTGGPLEVTTFTGSISRTADWVRVNGLRVRNNTAVTLPAMDYAVTCTMDSRWGTTGDYYPGSGIMNVPSGYSAGQNPLTITMPVPALAAGESIQLLSGAEDLRWYMGDIPLVALDEQITVTVETGPNFSVVAVGSDSAPVIGSAWV